jgi:poly(A) polymerase
MPFWRRKPPREDVAEEPELSPSEALLLDQPSYTFLRWSNEGKLQRILPDVESLRGISQLPAHRDDAFVHTLKVVDAIEPTPVRRWAALLHDIAKSFTFIETPEGRSRFFEHDKFGADMVPDIMLSVGEDPQLVEQVQRLVRLHMRPISYNSEWSDGAVRRLMEEAEEGRMEEEGWHDLLALSRADLRGYLPEPIDRGLWVLDQLEAHRNRLLEEERRAEEVEARQPRSPIDGHEILAVADREPGPWVAELKAYLAGEVRAGRMMRDDKERARYLVREWLDEHNS